MNDLQTDLMQCLERHRDDLTGTDTPSYIAQLIMEMLEDEGYLKK